MISRIAAVVAIGLACSAPARADEASLDIASLLHRDALTGDWFGYRKDLASDGIVLGADEILDALANPVGGQKQGGAFEGRFEVFANIDLGTAFGWHGAVLHANAYQIHGRGLSSDDVGNLLTVGNIGATPSTRLFTLWLQQSLLDDALSIRVGQIAADDEFFVSQYAALFINSTFGWPSIMGINLPSGGPAYPLATPGVRIKYALGPTLVISSAVFNGDPAPPGEGDPQERDASGTAFRLNGDLFWISELAYAASIPMDGDELPGTYKAGAWLHTGQFADQRYNTSGISLAVNQNTSPAQHQDDFGAYVIVDQLLLRTSGSSDQGLGAFLRAGADPADRNLIEFHADFGLSFTGLLPGHDNDVIGFGASYERVSSARRDLSRDSQQMGAAALPLADFESALELSYQAQIAPWWIVQPDMQVILHPGARLSSLSAAPQPVPGNAIILGARTAISL